MAYRKYGDLLCRNQPLKEKIKKISDLNKDELYLSLTASLTDLEIMSEDLKMLHEILFCKFDNQLEFSNSLSYAYMMESLTNSISELAQVHSRLTILSRSLLGYDDNYPIT